MKKEIESTSNGITSKNYYQKECDPKLQKEKLKLSRQTERNGKYIRFEITGFKIDCIGRRRDLYI